MTRTAFCFTSLVLLLSETQHFPASYERKKKYYRTRDLGIHEQCSDRLSYSMTLIRSVGKSILLRSINIWLASYWQLIPLKKALGHPLPPAISSGDIQARANESKINYHFITVLGHTKLFSMFLITARVPFRNLDNGWSGIPLASCQSAEGAIHEIYYCIAPAQSASCPVVTCCRLGY